MEKMGTNIETEPSVMQQMRYIGTLSPKKEISMQSLPSSSENRAEVQARGDGGHQDNKVL